MNDSVKNREWTVIINPVSGNGKGRHDWGIISGILDQYGISFKHHFCEYAKHGIELTSELAGKGCTDFIIVGGDGVLNEVVNGIFNSKDIDTRRITLAMIPVGTGNDWARTFKIPFDYKGAVKTIKEGKTRPHDIGKVYYQHNNEEKSRFFINMCGTGFDAEVNRKVNANKGHGNNGPLKYKYHIFTTLLEYQPLTLKLDIDGKSTFHDTFSLAVAIGKYNGGGMMQSPDAEPDDGIFNITLIKKIPKIKVLANVKRLYDGSFIKLPEVSCFTGKDIAIGSLPDAWLEADGEFLGCSPFRFEMLPSAINIIS